METVLIILFLLLAVQGAIFKLKRTIRWSKIINRNKRCGKAIIEIVESEAETFKKKKMFNEKSDDF